MMSESEKEMKKGFEVRIVVRINYDCLQFDFYWSVCVCVCYFKFIADSMVDFSDYHAG